VSGQHAPLSLVAHAASSPQALTPAIIHAAYSLPTTGARGQVIAIVSAYDAPSIQKDLNAYDKRFGLPACTAANKCLRKLNEQGQPSPLPPADTSGTWVTESSLGTETAHGVCQSCRILLVEANTSEKPDFAKAVVAAAHAGATVIVTTFTPPEDLTDSAYLFDFSSSRAVVVAAVGDPIAPPFGYTGSLNFPASLPNVLAVGGTQLSVGAGGAYAEQAWRGTVTGCSFFEPAPMWQARIAAASSCGSKRANADLSAVADPGAIVHVSGVPTPGGPWYTATGTSLAAPIIGGVIGLAGSLGSNEASTLYARELSDPGAFHDIRTGANASPCMSAICKAVAGWDGPTGLGTPNGLAAFLPSGGALDSRHPRLVLAAPQGQLHVGGAGTTRLQVTNNNPFAVSGQLVLRGKFKVGGSLRPLVLASEKLKLGPLAGASEKLTLAARYRNLLKGLGPVAVYAEVRVSGPAGRSVTVSKRILLSAP
jgi:hypothetical protein